MSRTIIRCLNTGPFRVMTDPEDGVLIVLRGGEDGGGVFVAEGGFELALLERGEGVVVGCWGDGCRCDDMGCGEVGLEGLEERGQEVEGGVVLGGPGAVGMIDSLESVRHDFLEGG
jgi:hypothetical protein